MSISDTISSMRALASVTAAVPVAGPALGAILQVATQVCEALEGVTANREEYTKLAAEVAQHARAVSEAVQSELQFAPGSQNMTDQQRRKVVNEIEKLTSVFREVEGAIKIRQEKDNKRDGNISNQAKRIWDGLQSKNDDKDKVMKLREKVESGMKAFQICTNIQVLSALQRIESSVHTIAATTIAEIQRIEASRLEEYESMISLRAEERRQDRIEREEETEREEIRRTKERRQDRIDKELDFIKATLAPVFSARFDAAGAPEPCLPQTRGALLDQIKAWASDDSPSSTVNIFCLTGLAGTGKTTIAQSVSSFYDRQRPLANFLISRSASDRRNPEKIIQTIVYQLGQCQDAVRTAIYDALRNGRDVTTRPLAEQVENLFTAPLRRLIPSSPPALIVIDALDECDKIGDREGGDLILLVADAVRRLSGRVKVLITSREERAIMVMFKTLGLNRPDISIRLQNIEDMVVQTDVELFYLHHFRRIAESAGIDFMAWPSKADLDLLVNRTGKLFVYAALIVRLFKITGGVSRVDPRKVLKTILHQSDAPTGTSAFRALDELYLGILEKAVTLIDDFDADVIERVRRVLAALVLVQTPLNSEAIAGLLAEDCFYIQGDIEHLSAVLMISDTPNEPVAIFHPSFADYIMTRCIDPRFRIDSVDYHTDLARCCLIIMTKHLKKNILDIPDAFVMNRDIKNLEVRNQCLPLELRYACEYWMTHLSSASGLDTKLKRDLSIFCDLHLLHWLEILSLLSKFSAALRGLPSVIRWCRQLQDSNMEATLSLLENVEVLIQIYDVPVRAAALQVYHSATTFLPVCPLYERYKNKASEFVRLRSKKLIHWPPLRRVLKGHNGPVWSVAFSPDGMVVSSSSFDGAVRVWDAITGRPLVPLKGHASGATSVAFSPDGMRIASGSVDKTVRVWDAVTGHQLTQIEAHTGEVTSVAFSPDGTRIVSGLWDKTVRVWDATTGHQLAQLEGHTGGVTSVTFSPDGMRIVSGSWDKTVRVWDPNSIAGHHLARLKGHTGGVTSITFSPDGMRIASSSWDKTVQIWDANTGHPLITLEGHTHGVTSVVFSPIGTRIASGSYDRTVRIWDANTGNQLAQLEDHTNNVACVAFSPDGTRIASSSDDSTIRVWNAIAGHQLSQLEGHVESVISVVFSPDRTRIASSSLDNTVRVWDANTGHQLAQLDGQTSQVAFLAFSSCGTQIASGSEDRTVRIWDVTTGQPLAQLEGHVNAVTSVAFAPDKMRIASGSEDKTVRIWDTITGHPIAQLEGHTSRVASVVFSPNGTHIASGSDDKTVRVWDTATGCFLAQLEGHTNKVRSVSFSPDGTCIASSSDDKTVRLWDALTGHPLTQLKVYTKAVMSVTFSMDGLHVISEDDDGQRSFLSIDPHNSNRESKAHTTPYILPINLQSSIMNLNKHSGWLIGQQSPESVPKRLCWIPLDRRGRLWVSGHVVVITTDAGGMTILSISQ